MKEEEFIPILQNIIVNLQEIEKWYWGNPKTREDIEPIVEKIYEIISNIQKGEYKSDLS